MEKVGNFRGNHGDSETAEQSKQNAHKSGKTYSENGKMQTAYPHPTHTGVYMYRIMCIAGAIIGIVFIIVLIKAMKEEVI